jgi:tryptophanyl-tRNA synthetase
MNKRYLTGMRITNDLHLGNYLGVISLIQSLELSPNDTIFMFVADLHSVTNGTIKNNPYNLVKFLLSSLSHISNIYYYIQSEIPEVCELAWIFTCNTSVGDLQRMTQFKEKSDKQGTNGGFLIYPMLMAADILMPKATHVPVGLDQTQHVEMARDVAKDMNTKYGTKFPVPEIVVCESAKIMDLKDCTKKMSKSNPNPNGAIFFTDNNDEIRSKIRSAVTDSLMMPHNIKEIQTSRPEIYNLCNIYRTLLDCDFSLIETKFGGGKTSDFKNSLCDVIINKLEPIRKFINETSNEQVREMLNKHKPFIQTEFTKTRQEVHKIFFNYESYITSNE